jgi:transcriptional regulator with GAF, ATPase, and Fis domain
VAPTETTVLISGESGTGKEVVARFIHRASRRKGRRFVAINCAAITPSLVESELFGHEKGAFTGADRRKEGKFEFAEGGTLFLDEVGDLPLETQAKLLRTLQERTIQRVGGNRDIPVDVRVICASNQNLERLVSQARFRQDLYYRIAVFPIWVPPLRQRRTAIVTLAAHFIKQFARTRELGKEMLTPGAASLIRQYGWPGNVRELANAMERAVILKSGALPITSDDLRFLRLENHGSAGSGHEYKLPPTGVNFERLQRSVIRQALEATAGNQSAAARMLGLTRARFRTMLKLVEGE